MTITFSNDEDEDGNDHGHDVNFDHKFQIITSIKQLNNNDNDELCRMLLATMIPMHSMATGLLKLPHLDAAHQ